MSEVIPAIGAGFAAVAATASAVSARAAVRTQREAESPQLVFANVQERPENPVLAVIENVGQGVALWVGFCILWRKIGAKGQLEPATLWPGRKAQFELPFIPAGEAKGIAWCSDRHKNVHAWNADDGYKLYRRKDVISDVDRVFADVYRDGPRRDHLLFGEAEARAVAKRAAISTATAETKKLPALREWCNCFGCALVASSGAGGSVDVQMSRESASWELSHWAGTLNQLEAAALIALREVQAAVPFPEGFDPEAPGYDQEKHQAYLAAEYAHKVSVTIIEKGGYTSHLDSLDTLVDRPSYSLDEIAAVVIQLGQGTPSAEIRLGGNGLAVEVKGRDRTWVAGLRQQLESALKPRYRLHAPFASEPIALGIPGSIGFIAISFGLDEALYQGTDWTKAGRVAVALGLAFLWIAVCGALAWASAKQSEVISEDGLPRYERWRSRVLGWAGTVILAVIGTAVYSVVTG